MDIIESIKTKIIEDTKILVVDDEIKILSVLKRLFRPLPYLFEYIDTPIEALKSVKETEYSMIISDNMMPGMSGLELLSKSKEFLPDCQRILLTGATKSDTAIEAFNTGTIHRFISKPFDNKELIDVVNTLINEHRSKRLTHIHNKIKDKTISQQKSIVAKTMKELKHTLTQLELQKAQAHIDTIEIPEEIKGLSFLVIEEDETIREAIEETLQKVGVRRAVSVENGTNALNYLHKVSSVNVVLSNWRMRDMDGLALFNTIRNSGLITPQPFFIMMTSNQNRQDIELALREKIDGYLIKPFKIETLIDQLNQIVSKNNHLIRKAEQKKPRKNKFLVASADISVCGDLHNRLKQGGIETIVVTHSGQSALHVVKNKKIDLMIYHDTLSNPSCKEIYEYATLQKIDISNLKLVVFSYIPLKKEERLRFSDKLPTAFLSSRYTDDDLVSSFRTFMDGFKLSDFNFRPAEEK